MKIISGSASEIRKQPLSSLCAMKNMRRKKFILEHLIKIDAQF